MSVAITSHSQSRQIRKRRHLRYAVGLFLLVVLTTYTAVLPVFRGDLIGYLSIDDATFGLMFSIGPLASIGVAMLTGPLIDRLGAIRMIRYSLWTAALGMGVLGLSGTNWIFMTVGLVLCTGGSSWLIMAGNRYVTQLFPRDRRRIMSLCLAVLSVGFMLLPLLAEALLSISKHVRGISLGWVIHGPFALIATALFAAGTRYYSKIPRKNKVIAKGQILDSLIPPAAVIWLTILLGLHGAADTTLFTWMPRYLGSATFSGRPIPPGVVLSAYSAAYLVSRLLLAMVPETWGKRRFMVLPGLLGGAAMVGGILSGSYLLAAGGYVVGAFLWSSEYPAMQGILAERSGRRLGMALAMANIPGGILTFLLIQGTGLVAQRTGDAHLDRAMLLPSLCFPLLGLGGLLWIRFFHPKVSVPDPVSILIAGGETVGQPLKTIQESV